MLDLNIPHIYTAKTDNRKWKEISTKKRGDATFFRVGDRNKESFVSFLGISVL